MKLKYFGSFSRFHGIVQDCGGFGRWDWLERGRNYRFLSQTGEILNWWPSTGTVSFQGQPGRLQPRLTAVFVRRAANDDGVRMVSPRAIIG